MRDVPVIAIDGPAASGKGTLAQRVAATLGFHYLESGALYRLVALKVLQEAVDPDSERDVANIATALDIAFDGDRVLLDGSDVTHALRSEAVSSAASRVAVHPAVRAALLERQRRFRRSPGLVADGRDMGSVVFPDAPLKVFVTASADVRAARRQRQLAKNGIDVNIQSLLLDIQQRDERDSKRAVAPLKAAPDALILDTTNLTIEESVAAVLTRVRDSGLA
ncbi:MAG TPA: (d)CMP kinase [Casimicrobiaceae bacterium]|nr:(d)CMP kinase [Casimicrobiaceae bacterium]